MKKINLKKLLPHFAAIVVFVVISIAFFSPLLEGKRLKQHDISQWKGMAQEVIAFQEKTGEQSLWTNSMFSGMPTWQIMVDYPFNVLKYIDKILQLGLPEPANYVFLYLIGFYFLLVTLGLNWKLSLTGAIGFAFSTYYFIIIEAGHNSKAHAIAFLPVVIAGVFLTFRGNYKLGAGITALFLGLQIYANHLQITYYMLIFLIIFGIVEFVHAVRNRTLSAFLKSTAVLIPAAIIAIACNITNLWATFDYSKDTTRGKSELTSDIENKTSGLDKDYATAWSYGVSETMTLMIPNFKGGGSGRIGTDPSILKDVDPNMRPYIADRDSYFGDQPFTSGPVYTGAIVVFLFVLGIFILNGRLKWILLTATVISIMLAWGKNFMSLTDFFLDHIPFYDKFRAVSMILIIAEFAIPLMAILALERFISGIEKKDLEELTVPFIGKLSILKVLVTSFALTGGICLLIYLLPTTFNSFYKAGEFDEIFTQVKQNNPEDVSYQFLDNLQTARIAIMQSDALRSFLLILAAAALMFIYIKTRFSSSVLIAGMGLFILGDLWGVNMRYLDQNAFVSKSNAENPFRPTQADLQILADPDPNYRVFNRSVNTFNDASTSYYHKSIGGYHGAKLKRYQELIENHISKGNMSVFNMLNTKYFIMPDDNQQPVVQINRAALGNAWFVQDAQVVKNADEEMAALESFDPSATAIVDQRFENLIEGLNFKQVSPDTSVSAEDQPIQNSGTEKGVIKLKSYKPNHLVYESKSGNDELAVFSEIYYNKGWNAYIDGKLTPHIRANYVLRALKVPGGEHQVEFRFESPIYKTGRIISISGGTILMLFLGYLLIGALRKKVPGQIA